jgi:hypothetical protein
MTDCATTKGHAGTGISKCYSFEVKRPAGKLGRARHLSETDRDLSVLVQRLNLNEAYQQTFEQPLKDFVVHHHLNIRWYDQAIKKELRLRRLYFLGNLLMLAAIPGGVYLLTSRSNQDGAGLTAESISTILAGLFGVQRALTAWLDKRQLVALYSKTRAKLKTAVYSFEQTWRHAKWGDDSSRNFESALSAATDAARAVVAEEQEQHYDIEAAPTFSLQDMLSSATGGAKTLTAQLAAKETADQIARREGEASVRALDAEVAECQRLVAKYRDELSRSTTPDEKQRLMGLINAASAKQRAAELDRAVAMSKLKALAA